MSNLPKQNQTRKKVRLLPPAKKVKNLYDTFVAARDREERGLTNNDVSESLSSLKGSDSRRQGNTVYVFGYQITEELLKKAFASLGGKIVNISMEVCMHTTLRSQIEGYTRLLIFRKFSILLAVI